jgi:DNA-binding beta-propeller fold protein YncE
VYITVGGGQQKMNELQELVDSLLLLYAAESDLRQIRRQVVEFTQRRKASSDDDGDGSQQAEPQTTVVDKGKQNAVDDDDEEEDDGQALPPLNRKPVQLALEKDKLALGQAPLRYDRKLLLKWCDSRQVSHLEGRFPHGVAVDREGDRMFVADSGHHRILVLSLNGAFRTAIGSTPPTQLIYSLYSFIFIFL